MIYDLRIDIEKVEPNGDCSRPVDDVLLCESEQTSVIEEQWERVRRLFPGSEWTINRDKAIYTVFVWKIDEQESTDYYEEMDLAEFSNLKNAKKLMKEVIGTFQN